ncbi:MAG: SH3 domain-containing protein [Chloroflexi bacterium]|nr:SH3 domain-containing protein [Chloroflexota bacterium]
MLRNDRFLTLLLVIFLLFSVIQAPVAHPVKAQDAGNTVTIATGAANIRSGPSFGTTVLGIAYAGEVLPVSGQSGTGWWRVETQFGTGWVSARITIFRGNRDAVPVTSEPAGLGAPTTIVAASGPVKVYSNPNANSFVVTIIPTGGSAEIIGQTGDGGWYQVSTPAGTGFVSYAAAARRGPLDGISVVGDPGPSFRGPTVQLNAGQNIVSEGGEVIGSLPAGATLPITGRNADNTRWRVAVDGVGIGWINVANASIAGAASEVPLVNASTIPGPPPDDTVHATATTIVERKLFYANTSFTVVMLDGGRGTQVGIIGRTSDGLWLRVIVGSNVVWMVFSGITLNGDMAAIPVVDDIRPNRNHIVVNAYSLNVRTGPGPEYAVIAQLSGGTAVRATGVSPDRVWWRVEDESFGVGWVRTRYILFRGDVNTIPVVTEPVGELEAQTVVTRRPAPVYSWSDRLQVVGELPMDTEYVVLGRDRDWTMYMIDTSYGQVWIAREDIYFRGFWETVPLVE